MTATETNPLKVIMLAVEGESNIPNHSPWNHFSPCYFSECVRLFYVLPFVYPRSLGMVMPYMSRLFYLFQFALTPITDIYCQPLF